MRRERWRTWAIASSSSTTRTRGARPYSSMGEGYAARLMPGLGRGGSGELRGERADELHDLLRGGGRRAGVERGLRVILDAQLDALGVLGARDPGGQAEGHV